MVVLESEDNCSRSISMLGPHTVEALSTSIRVNDDTPIWLSRMMCGSPEPVRFTSSFSNTN